MLTLAQCCGEVRRDEAHALRVEAGLENEHDEIDHLVQRSRVEVASSKRKEQLANEVYARVGVSSAPRLKRAERGTHASWTAGAS